MSDAGARTATNALIASAGLVAAYVIVKKPRLRRLVFQMARFWIGTAVSGYLVEEARQARLSSRPSVDSSS